MSAWFCVWEGLRPRLFVFAFDSPSPFQCWYPPPPNFPPRTLPPVNLSWQQFSLFLYLHRIFIDPKHRGRWCPNLRTPKAGENVVALAWKIGGKRGKASNWHYHPFSHPPLCSFPQLPLTPRRLEGHPRRLEGHPPAVGGSPTAVGGCPTAGGQQKDVHVRARDLPD